MMRHQLIYIDISGRRRNTSFGTRDAAIAAGRAAVDQGGAFSAIIGPDYRIASLWTIMKKPPAASTKRRQAATWDRRIMRQRSCTRGGPIQ
jgi:hypothetical protein